MQHQGLEQTQQLRQQLRINPRQLALGRLLEMTAPEFEDRVRHELDENPALEASDPEPVAAEVHDELDGDDDTPYYLRYGRNRSADDPVYDAAALAADPEADSMLEVLGNRLANEADLTAQQLLAAEYIIGSIDENGYLTRPLPAIASDIAVAEGTEVSPADMEAAYTAVLALDPPGIGASDLRHCLLLQLRRHRPSQAVDDAIAILEQRYDDFSHRRFESLAERLNLSRERLAEALEAIRGLNPKPGSAFGSSAAADRTRHITPDFSVDYDRETDRFSVALADNIPELAIEQSFRADAPLTTSDPAAERYIRSRRDAAAEFIALAGQRAQTLSTLARAIVDLQRRYFITADPKDIRPMVLRDLSERTGLSVSTISRALSGKYIQTPHGVVAVKSLFNEASAARGDTASPAVLEALAAIIAAEDKHNPLPDEQLAALLAEQGYPLARRTVAKYRERLGLPTARLRKQL